PLQPEARFAAAALASAEGGGPAAWAAYVADEPFSLRSARVQLGVATVSRMSTSRHGGQVWDVSADGTRILYADAFRGQLQATDVAGMGLAAQLTDQESEKRWAAWSPDEQWLAWVTDGALWLQRTGSSGTHRPVLRTNAGRTLRRTAWTADGQYLLVSEVAVREQSSVLRCYSLAESAEVPPPAPLDRPGLGDVRCLPDGSGLAVLSVAAQQAIVQIQPDGATQLLRPWAPWGSYTAPDLAPDGQRVLWHDSLSDQLLVGPADGSEGWLVPLAGSTASAAGARFVPGGAAVVYSAHGRRPIWLGLDGLAPQLALRVSWPAPGEAAPRAAWIAEGSERVAMVSLADAADGLREVGRGRLGDGLSVDLPREPGEHWLCLTLADARQDELPRWYRWVVPEG
ncbi:MAG TPA: hypothetical protein DCZ72_06665, partial [Armatimonadetes bacterium]|nr:hypothetical protein [Armatimonadota bacterium]